jgi:hypothetical protein
MKTQTTDETVSFTPENLKLWTTPKDWFGQPWSGHYVFLGQHRDSDALSRSNFRSGLKAIGGESDTVTVVRESHWAVGWVEWIAIEACDSKALKIADEIKAGLDDYPVVDESDWSEEEMNEANEVWKACYDASERIEYIREHRSQFEFHGFADLLSCVRGNYFAGYASELLN